MAPPPSPPNNVGLLFEHLFTYMINFSITAIRHTSDRPPTARQAEKQTCGQTDRQQATTKKNIFVFLSKSDSEYLSKLSKKFQQCLGGRGDFINIFVH